MDSLNKYRKPMVMLILALIALTAGRGLLRTTPLAGHDAAAYPVNQAQFMENLRDGVLFPRWSPDTRFGYGQPQLQFRPPFLHYLASPIHAVTGNPFLALHLALIVSLFIAAWGAYALARLRIGEWPALIAAAGFVCANYLLANLYLRGAYYEVVASAAMPWILWAQSRENTARRCACLIGPVAWAALLTAHPAVAFFFFPLAAAHALSETLLARRWSILAFSFAFLVVGVMLSAPYTWVMLAERHWARLEIFLSNLDSWRRHFFTLREWFTERWPRAARGWPETYMEYRGFDYLHRALRPEMRGLNFWAMTVLIFSPLGWWLTLRNWRSITGRVGQPCPTETDGGTGCPALPRPFFAEILFNAIFFYAAVWFSLALSLRLSQPVWNHLPAMNTFNYPWRVLNVTGLCLALATAYGLALLSAMMKQLASLISPGEVSPEADWRSGRSYRMAGAVLIALFILWPLAEAIPRSGGWSGPKWLTHAELTPSAMRRHAGIPQQFYTPTWVRRYATEPAQTDAQAVAGTATVSVIERRPTRWRLRIEASTPAQIVLSHYYYPGWRVHGFGGAIAATAPWGERGLISFSVPAGIGMVEVRFGSTPARRAANSGFAAGLAFLLLSGLWPRKSGSNLTLILNKTESDTAGPEAPALPVQNVPSIGNFAISVCAVILLVGAILLAEYLVNNRDDEIRTIEAGQQLAEGKTQAAIHSFARLLRERETDIAARYNLGAAYHNDGWHDEALADYNDVLNLANEYAARAAHSAARISIMREDFEGARQYYEEALRHRPNANDIRAEYEQLLLMLRSPGKDVSFP